MPARLSRSRSVPRHSRCTPQQNANRRHKALCWQDFNMGIVNSRGKRGVGCPGALIPPAVLQFVRGLGVKVAPGKFNICICLTTSSPGSETVCLCGDWPSQHFTETFIRLSACRHADKIQHLTHPWTPLPQLDPKLLPNQAKCDMCSPTVHQTLTVLLSLDFCGSMMGLFHWHTPLLHNAGPNVSEILWRNRLLFFSVSLSLVKSCSRFLSVKRKCFLATVAWTLLAKIQALGCCQASRLNLVRGTI